MWWWSSVQEQEMPQWEHLHREKQRVPGLQHAEMFRGWVYMCTTSSSHNSVTYTSAHTEVSVCNCVNNWMCAWMILDSIVEVFWYPWPHQHTYYSCTFQTQLDNHLSLKARDAWTLHNCINEYIMLFAHTIMKPSHRYEATLSPNLFFVSSPLSIFSHYSVFLGIVG